MSSNMVTSDILRKEIDVMLSSIHGSQVNICYALYKIISKAEDKEKPKLLRYVAEVYEYIDSTKEISIDAFITENEKEQLKDRYGNLVDEMLALLLKENLIEDDFYIRLWTLLQNPIFEEEKICAFVCYYILIDRRIPYFHLDQGLRMTKEDYEGLIEKLRKQRAKLRFILASKFEQIAEESDLILKELDKVDYVEKVSLMSYIIWRMRTDTKEIIDRVRREAQ
jgi:hypothetical protein